MKPEEIDRRNLVKTLALGGVTVLPVLPHLVKDDCRDDDLAGFLQKGGESTCLRAVGEELQPA
jgi:hypothetical protein